MHVPQEHSNTHVGIHLSNLRNLNTSTKLKCLNAHNLPNTLRRILILMGQLRLSKYTTSQVESYTSTFAFITLWAKKKPLQPMILSKLRNI
jgi:hypothetical protein